MQSQQPLIVGEFARSLDDRYRLSVPNEMMELLAPEAKECVLVKERRGCLSLWNPESWKTRWEAGVELIRQKVQMGRLDMQLSRVQQFGRLLSSRFRVIPVAQRSRIVIPEGFREFLGVEPGAEVMIVGAAVCIEIWHPEHWRSYLERRMPRFPKLYQLLSQ
jgi:MraZ protein